MRLLVSNQEGGGQGKEVPTTNHPPRNTLMGGGHQEGPRGDV